MQTILITGGTGLIGKALAADLLGRGYRVIIITRHPAQYKSREERLRYAGWDPERGWIDPWAIGEADHIINLAGAGVADKRWTPHRKQLLVNSRVSGGNVLAEALAQMPNKVQTLVQASAIGWYGADPVNPNPHPFMETAPADGQFLGATCRQWEASIEPIKSLGKRVVVLRIGLVLTPAGGALKEFLQPLRLGIAVVMGDGRQVFSWIHIRDLCKMMAFAIERPEVSGVYNAVAPHPESNRNLMIALARMVRGRKYILVPVPSLVLKILLGEMSVEVLKSATVSARKIGEAGFTFSYPEIHFALQDLFP